ncbi:MAG: hypothetical protein HAW62_02495 [Endozoicomonadaceae bacterium]|nr:hypothetical protein [Endozoicomonadaceae bacterium]
MSGFMSDIRQGIVGISHTSNLKQVELPDDKKILKPSVDAIQIHIASTLNLTDSDQKIKQFIRGENLDSYSPQDQKALRTNVMLNLKNAVAQHTGDNVEIINQAIALFKEDEGLEKLANMARNVLISA